MARAGIVISDAQSILRSRFLQAEPAIFKGTIEHSLRNRQDTRHDNKRIRADMIPIRHQIGIEINKKETEDAGTYRLFYTQRQL